MGVSKVNLDGKALIDLTGDTITPESMLSGYKAHGKDGDLRIGNIPIAIGRPNATKTVVDGSYLALTAPKGYYDGSIPVEATVESVLALLGGSGNAKSGSFDSGSMGHEHTINVGFEPRIFFLTMITSQNTTYTNIYFADWSATKYKMNDQTYTIGNMESNNTGIKSIGSSVVWRTPKGVVYANRTTYWMAME